MSIGLYDADMSKYIYVPFNLELMKLATYYKKHREIVGLNPTLSPDMYSTLFYRKDYPDNDFSPAILKNNNVIYGGRAFSSKLYIPLEEEIEKQIPDVYIYDIFKPKFCTTKEKNARFITMQNAIHLRLSLDNKTVWENYNKQIGGYIRKHTVFLHDYDLNKIEGSFEAIQDICSNMNDNRLNRYIANKFPIIVENPQDLFKWSDVKPSSSYFLINYNGLMDDEVFVEFIEKQKIGFMGRQLDYYITKDCKDERDFIDRILPRMYRQLFYARINKQKVNFRYDNNFFVNKQWERLIDFLNAYNNNVLRTRNNDYKAIIKNDSLYRFARSMQEKPRFKNSIFSRQDARELFQLVRIENYDVFKEFYQCHSVELRGGKIELC